MEYAPLTEAQAAYYAGFIDGEGCVWTGKAYAKTQSGKRWRVTLHISQVDPRPLQTLLSLIGGKLYLGKQGKLSKKPIWEYAASGSALDRLFPAILPYLVVKKDKVELAISMRALIRAQGTRPITAEQEGARLALVQSLPKAA